MQSFVHDLHTSELLEILEEMFPQYCITMLSDMPCMYKILKPYASVLPARVEQLLCKRYNVVEDLNWLQTLLKK